MPVFASDFLQIPLRNGHPCLSLTVPTTKSVTDFHRQVITHAGRTIRKTANKVIDLIGSSSIYVYLVSLVFFLRRPYKAAAPAPASNPPNNVGSAELVLPVSGKSPFSFSKSLLFSLDELPSTSESL